MPKTLDAKLMCGKCARFTLHLFQERRAQPKTPGPAAVGPLFVDLIYVCDVCETERIFGNEPVSGGGWAGDREMREEHAALVHGMRAVDCPACGGVGEGPDVDCSECSGCGEVWQWEKPEPCGPDCPLDQGEDR